MEKIKAKLRIPTTQYGFIEFEVEDTPENIETFYYRMVDKYKDGFGIEEKEYNKVLDRYLTKGDGNLEIFHSMSEEQQRRIQDLKRAFKRIKSRL